MRASFTPVRNVVAVVVSALAGVAVAGAPPSMPEGGAADFVVVVVNGTIHALGRDFPTHFTCASGSNTWEARRPIPTDRRRFAAAAVDGMIYVFGGLDGGTDNEMYSPAMDTWAAKADMPTPRVDAAAAAANGKIYVVGGRKTGPGGKALRTVEEYNPVADTWRTLSDMPTARHGLAVAAAQGKIYAIGGYSSRGDRTGKILATTEEYDPATDTWLRLADMPTPRARLAVLRADGKVQAIGGLGAPQLHLSLVEEYDPSTDGWESVTPGSVQAGATNDQKPATSQAEDGGTQGGQQAGPAQRGRAQAKTPPITQGRQMPIRTIPQTKPRDWLKLRECRCIALLARKRVKVRAFAGSHRGRTVYLFDTSQIKDETWRQQHVLVEPESKCVSALPHQNARLAGPTVLVDPDAVASATRRSASGWRSLVRPMGKKYLRIAVMQGKQVLVMRVDLAQPGK